MLEMYFQIIRNNKKNTKSFAYKIYQDHSEVLSQWNKSIITSNMQAKATREAAAGRNFDSLQRDWASLRQEGPSPDIWQVRGLILALETENRTVF